MEWQWYRWLALFSLAYCLVTCMWFFFRLIRRGRPSDYSRPSGEVPPAVRYAFTGALNPARKESALLHFPTYFAGIIYHIGTFISVFLFFFLLTGHTPPTAFSYLLSTFLFGTALAGLGIFTRRLAMNMVRMLSIPDDYLSNLLVTFFQIFTAVMLVFPKIAPGYFVLFSMLMLYIPAGKLRHTVYFFAARYFLGFFYGWRGVWPPGKVKS